MDYWTRHPFEFGQSSGVHFKALALSLFFAVGALQVVKGAGYINSEAVQEPSIEVDLLSTRILGQMFLGTGIDFRDPNNPRSQGQIVTWEGEQEQRRLTKDGLLIGAGKPAAEEGQKSSHRASSKFRYIDNSTLEQESSSMASEYGGSAGFLGIGGSASQARTKAKEIVKQYRVRALVMENPSAIVETIDRTSLTLRQKPADRPRVGDPLEVLLTSHGSHYVSTMEYGYSIVISAKALLSDTKAAATLEKDFGAGFSVAGLKGGVEGHASNAAQKRLAASGVQFLLSVESGSLVDTNGVDVRLNLTVDGIVDTLQRLANNEIRIIPAPRRLTARTLRDVLDPAEFPNLVQALSPVASTTPVEAKFLVPPFTIVAWHPPARFREGGMAPPPAGWAVCDGRHGTPNLTGRFLRGLSAGSEPGQTGGSEEHTHLGLADTVKTGKPSKSKDSNMTVSVSGPGVPTVGTHTHKLDVKSANNLPPYFEVIYIMKLEERSSVSAR